MERSSPMSGAVGMRAASQIAEEDAMTMTAPFDKSETRDSKNRMERDAAFLRLVSVAAAFGGGWLAGRVERRAGLPFERRFVGDAEMLPAAAKAGSYVATSIGYPL